MTKQAALLAVGIIAGFAALGVLGWKGYLPWGSAPVNTDGGALSPAGWQTYRNEVWSIDYPSDWSAYERTGDGATGFAPTADAEEITYLIVLEYDMTYTAALRASEDDAYRETGVTIANYEATKFELGSGRHEYVINYKDRVVVLATDVPDNDAVGIMLASFGFLK